MSSQAAKSTVRHVRPLLSLDEREAKRRVLSLYKSWVRQLPYLVRHYDIPKSQEQCHVELRRQFNKHGCVTDIRVIDMLVIKGQMELKEAVNAWKQKSHMMRYFNPTAEPKPKDFLSKFIQGVH